MTDVKFRQTISEIKGTQNDKGNYEALRSDCYAGSIAISRLRVAVECAHSGGICR